MNQRRTADLRAESDPQPARPLGRTPRQAGRRPAYRARPTAVALLAALLGLAVITAGCSGADADSGPKLAADAPLPTDVPKGTVLRIGDPATQAAIEASGLDKEVDALGFDVEWANLSGGPKTTEAFRAGALDVGQAQDIPPLFATWTDTPVRIVATTSREDPLNHPVYELGVAPGQKVESLEDLKGKKIAYSPGQAQGAVVLRALDKAGLTEDDVELVEIQSVDDTYVNALASKQVDVAPLGGTLLTSYLSKYESDGASSIPTGLRDDWSLLYTPVETVEDPGKAAALAKFLPIWVKAKKWIDEHPKEYAQAYYVDVEGLTLQDGLDIIDTIGHVKVETDWDGPIAAHQETTDLLVEKQGQPELDVATIYDRRYEKVIADAVAQGGTS